MKASRFSFILILVSLLSFYPALAQDTTSIKIAVLPISSNGIDSISVNTIQSILEFALTKKKNVIIITSAQLNKVVGTKDCMSSKCAEEIGKQTGAARVLGCKLAPLGDKIMVQYFITDVKSGKDVLLDQVAAMSIEDLQPVMERIAISTVQLIPVSGNAEVGKIYKEESEEPLRRSSRKNIGISFGYLYPQNGYDNVDKSFVVDFHLDYELEDYAVGMMLAARKGFAMNIYGDFLFSRKDICPYLGGAFGFHWISHNSPVYDFSGETKVQKSSDGFEFSLNTGLRILHTYNFQIVVNLEYAFSFNDYQDQAIVFTIGIL